MVGNTPKEETGAQAAKTSATGIPAPEKMNRGDEYLCEICALSLHVEECGEFLASKGPTCCGHPMKKKTGESK